MAQKGTFLTNIQIDQLIELAATFERFFRFCADFMALFGQSLNEMRNVRAALKRGHKVVNIKDVLGRLPDDHIAIDALERSTLVKFELGRLWVQAQDSFDLCSLGLAKGLLKSALKDAYGVDHKIRIIPPTR